MITAIFVLVLALLEIALIVVAYLLYHKGDDKDRCDVVVELLRYFFGGLYFIAAGTFHRVSKGLLLWFIWGVLGCILYQVAPMWVLVIHVGFPILVALIYHGVIKLFELVEEEQKVAGP